MQIKWIHRTAADNSLTSTSPLLVRLLYSSDGESVTNKGGAACIFFEGKLRGGTAY
jgi:hypothetical protein